MATPTDDDLVHEMMATSVEEYLIWEARGYCLTCQRPEATCRCIHEYPEVDDYGRRFRWEANHSIGKHVRIYQEATDAD